MTSTLRDAIYALRKARLGLERRRLDYGRETDERAERLAAVLPASIAELREYEREYDSLEWFHDAYADRVAEIHEAGVATDTTHWRDGATLYVVCRALEVETAVETGVLFGSFDAHILAAMERNGGGTLHAVDLPGGPPGRFDYGHLIPDRCRDRWRLHRGDAREVLPALLERVGPLDLFLHDSDHRLPHMRFEYETALSHLESGGVLASHDVRLSRLFDRFTEENGLQSCVVCDTGIGRQSR
ncbi:class I SAM-dependent methyltransferase [Haloterrigena sp. SYSU A558-1]|uniref:Class I SAM-dependent methyltransferase n=1 Tax=Haloterrigena gelatinilytica TaxID=2741724 RepID=A0A8J8GJU3_9EURY|nr:class I SAM-dependent methyltransferase [Haloterrigena gelatinilytica]NUB90901.1 class I SAM-dependent methyltransferase [Haloterrigena gelatinilytica]NUC73280.1 class I SAM-dependent methyltransferase [Haloterrigena gelatinilytica]